MMKRHALVIASVVVNVVESPALPTIDLGGTWITDQAGTAGVGHRWNGSTFDPPAAPPPATLTRRQFWKRWTRNERENFEEVRANGNANQKRRLSAFAENVADGDIDLTEAYWGNQLAWMEANGANVLGAGVSILAAGRAAQILAG